MSQNDLFTFTCPITEADIVKTDIELNALHQIFEAHFPGRPVLPGAYMVQMVKEVAEAYINKKIKLVLGQDLKFLSVINPEENTMIQMELKISTEDEKIRIAAQLLGNAIVFFKFKGIFVQM
ncbi:MAG: 3-hydroxyacyl-ACP dehydratase [Mucilaginibacter sp.]|nr:3-hydroxyacyl-ACP dehydratase [Mucilaginibacter sp.]